MARCRAQDWQRLLDEQQQRRGDGVPRGGGGLRSAEAWAMLKALCCAGQELRLGPSSPSPTPSRAPLSTLFSRP